MTFIKRLSAERSEGGSWRGNGGGGGGGGGQGLLQSFN